MVKVFINLWSNIQHKCTKYLFKQYSILIMREIKIERTIMERDAVSISKYLNEIHGIPLLSIEEEVKLAKKIRLGDQQALEKLVKANLRFVVSVAKTYQHRGLSLGDLISEGNLGLIFAANRFDETKGFRFISFAVWWIRQRIMMAIPEYTRTIRLPMNMISSISKINRVTSMLEQKYERTPTLMEVAEETEINPEIVSIFLDKARPTCSLDAIHSHDSDNTLLDLMQSSDRLTDHFLTALPNLADFQKMLKPLSKREARVIILYFGLNGVEPLSLTDISLSFNLSRERIRQIKDAGLNKLRVNRRGGIKLPAKTAISS